MPGFVVFGRRWAVGSDDLIVPGIILLILHTIMVISLSCVMVIWAGDAGKGPPCSSLLLKLLIGHVVLIAVTAFIELGVCIVSLRGGILDSSSRTAMPKLIYTRFAVLGLDIVWLSLSIAWLTQFYPSCPEPVAREVLLAVVVTEWCIVLSMLGMIWCIWDAAGRSWVKLKRYQRAESRLNRRSSGSRNRNWRQRKVIRAYQDSWDHRCRILFCCMRHSDREKSSFADIARLLSDFFRELDVVPSDVVAGLVLLRRFQKIEQQHIVKQRKNDVYEFLSGVPVTSRTQFLALNDPAELEMFQLVVHYMHYALGAYGWPMFLMTSSSAAACGLCANLSCCCNNSAEGAVVVHDNCCQCNYTALRQLLEVGDVDILYATYHVDVAETPFFIAVDHDKKAVVLSIRGTLSMKDVMTDLNAECEPLPLTPPCDDWFGHKGMVQAAEYILTKLERDKLLERAFNSDPSKGTTEYNFILVGHSLGAGTAAILAILLKPQYPNLKCYSYSPPGGLLSMPAVEYSKQFTISVVLGKDVVPRIGLHQLEALRADLINAIQRSVDPKWKTIICTVCCCHRQPKSAVVFKESGATGLAKYQQAKDVARSGLIQVESGGTLTLHRPLYPPGRILHLVRHHPDHTQKVVKKREPVYQAVWAENTDFDEVLISPGMIQDHMPDKVLEALNKVINQTGPRKPQRTSVTQISSPMEPPPHRICLETSFTSLNNPTINVQVDSSKTSSITGSFYNSSSTTTKPTAVIQSPIQFNSIMSYDFSALLDEQLQMAGGSRTLTPSAASERLMNQPLGVYSFAPNSQHRKQNGNGVESYVPKLEPVMRSADHTFTFIKSDGNCKVDLIHDDWFGLAPLASPESLSELSSISSRTSLCQINEKCATNIVTIASVLRDAEEEKPELILSPEYALSTPTVLRRTPKITGNLSTCADDLKSVAKFQKLNQNYRFLGRRVDGSQSGSSRESSFESGTSGESNQVQTVRSIAPVVRSPLKYVPRVDSPIKYRRREIDQNEPLLVTKEGFHSVENFVESKHKEESFVTKSDTNILDESSDNKFFKKENGNLGYKDRVQNSDISAFPSTKSSESFDDQRKVFESSFSSENSPLHNKSEEDDRQLLENLTMCSPTENEEHKRRGLISQKKRCKLLSDRIMMSQKNESLPLLSNIATSVSHSPPSSYVKRKKCIYPASTSNDKNESNV